MLTSDDGQDAVKTESGAKHQELANSVTHGLGIVGAVVATVVLVWLSVANGSAWHVTGSAIFGGTMILLYTASTLYHTARTPRARARLQVLDHCAIYLLIAGTYTPFMLGALRGGWGWSILGLIWGMAVAGVIFKLFTTGRLARLSTAIYIGMGWLIVVAAVPMMQRLTPTTLAWLIAGGLCYTGGTLFYHSRRIPYAHAVWHLFVLGGSVCHAIAVGTQIV